jgi:5-methylcytosine-specific restriction endonuclease McrBC regulatory subunit McrC
MSEGYRPLMQVGKAIIRRFGAARSDAAPGESSFFIDVAEIWENYLEAILTRHLPSAYKVINPNRTGGHWLFVGQKREIRPDLIIEKNGVSVAILDAKFKAYSKLGEFARDGVSREDLYQMATYMYHYGEDRNTQLLGLFVSPEKGSADRPDLHRLDKRPNHAIGLLNFDLDRWRTDGPFDRMGIKAYEEKFAADLKQLIESHA